MVGREDLLASESAAWVQRGRAYRTSDLGSKDARHAGSWSNTAERDGARSPRRCCAEHVEGTARSSRSRVAVLRGKPTRWPDPLKGALSLEDLAAVLASVVPAPRLAELGADVAHVAGDWHKRQIEAVPMKGDAHQGSRPTHASGGDRRRACLRSWDSRRRWPVPWPVGRTRNSAGTRGPLTGEFAGAPRSVPRHAHAPVRGFATQRRPHSDGPPSPSRRGGRTDPPCLGRAMTIPVTTHRAEGGRPAKPGGAWQSAKSVGGSKAAPQGSGRPARPRPRPRPTRR